MEKEAKFIGTVIFNEEHKRPKKGKNAGLQEGEERVSFILLDDQYEKIQAIAYWERQTLKETVIEIFKKAIDEYEAKNGTIQPKPKKKKKNERQ